MKLGFLRGSRRYRRLYLRQSLRFWVLGALLCLVAAIGAVAVKFMFDEVAKHRGPKTEAVTKR
jgi:hypothetical protein